MFGCQDDAALAELDPSGDGMLTRAEFLAWWSGHSSSYKPRAAPQSKESVASTLLARTLAGTPGKSLAMQASIAPISPLVRQPSVSSVLGADKRSNGMIQSGSCTTGYLSFGPMAQCVVHALKGLACRARVTPASSPASHYKQCSALTSLALHARGCASPSRAR